MACESLPEGVLSRLNKSFVLIYSCGGAICRKSKKISRGWNKNYWGHDFEIGNADVALKQCLVGGLVAIFGIFPLILGMSSSQLTKSYVSEGWPNHQPDVVGVGCFLYFVVCMTVGYCRVLYAPWPPDIPWCSLPGRHSAAWSSPDPRCTNLPQVHWWRMKFCNT